MNYKWPSTEANDIAPWYIVLRRLPFAPFLYTGIAFTTIMVAAMWGIEAAHDWYERQGL